ncbi:hypothetical protein BJ138DRAFT_1107221 [Hygrophoropsis aurantiaca]|uniref:Uncharacterized protein n=1 Tax=Hygrophoropsis aurantiaca TaxID=72124 RepID=A0ACB7ZT37_9AGAM|nr:hypothetical protein BJ138DRAFT_1107221 [Hygrophoropsis aurantiaca]
MTLPDPQNSMVRWDIPIAEMGRIRIPFSSESFSKVDTKIVDMYPDSTDSLEFETSRLKSIAQDLASTRARLTSLEEEFSSEVFRIYAAALDGAQDERKTRVTITAGDPSLRSIYHKTLLQDPGLVKYIESYYTDYHNTSPPWRFFLGVVLNVNSDETNIQELKDLMIKERAEYGNMGHVTGASEERMNEECVSEAEKN